MYLDEICTIFTDKEFPVCEKDTEVDLKSRKSEFQDITDRASDISPDAFAMFMEINAAAVDLLSKQSKRNMLREVTVHIETFIKYFETFKHFDFEKKLEAHIAESASRTESRLGAPRMYSDVLYKVLHGHLLPKLCHT